MKRAAAIALLVIATLPAASQPARGNPDMSFRGETVDSMIAAFMKEHDVPGMAVAIVQAPYITRVTGYGVSDRDRRTLVSADTLFDVGQMRDAYTAVAVMQLVEAGKIALDDVRERLRTADPTLVQLVEKASGTSHEEFIRRNQFERLGLEHTFFGADLSRVPREEFAAGERHRKFLDDPTLVDPTEPATGYATGAIANAAPRAIYSSAHDISVWDIALAGTILIKDAALRNVLFVPGDAKRVGAWRFPGHPGLMIATGSANGFSSLLSRYTDPSELVCVTLLANREGLDLNDLAARIAAAHNAKLAPK
jgi:CubicO group peptidase (beta-lactamase class C family)